ncbi:uncharacterized protein IL334_003224 [Kwoniella shivajii]|uniref:Uncharacterized protein n=1 Tax=Kwoniella shivajii TaxID=564305 RepID=A0ABZ1CXB7_9TREE|nr:hypothetical protein IL334_003224 [Kwoniella shivajii]
MRIPILLAAQIQSTLASTSSSSTSTKESLSISGPSKLQSCTPTTFNWTSTSAPYTISIIEKSTQQTDQDQDQEELEMVTLDENKVTWIVDVVPGNQVSMLVKDSKGNTAETLSWTVEHGGIDCLDLD